MTPRQPNGWKQVVRSLLPEWLWGPVQRRFFRVRWTGDYPSWAAAREASRGYDAPAILERVRQAAILVRDGRAAFERDGVAFKTPATDALLLDSLRLAAAENAGVLNVLDFGGALGSSYWQHRSALEQLGRVTWRVVEQPAFVAVGQQEFAHGGLRFYEHLEVAWAEARPDFVLLSSVLPYVEAPHKLAAEVVARSAPWVMIARTGIVDGPCDRLTVQHVPRTIYAGSYPCWFLSRQRLLAHFAGDYALRANHPAPDGHESGFQFWTFLFRRHQP